MSKKLVNIFLLLLSANLVIGQSTEELDLRHGFKDIKLGSSESELSDKITFKSESKQNAKIFEIKNLSSYDVFGKSLREGKLAFEKGKLTIITLTTSYYQAPTSNGSESINVDEFNSELSAFKRLFGKPSYEGSSKSESSLFLYYWEGKTTILAIEYCNKMNGGSWIEITLIDKSAMDKSIKSGF